MRRRFSRRRRSGGGDGRSPIDAASAIAKILEHKVVDTESLDVFEAEDVPDSYAVLARGAGADGTRLLVSYAPLGGDALLGAIAAGLTTQTEDGAAFAGDVFAVAPTWTAAGLQRLGRVGPLPFRLRAITAPALAEGAAELEQDPWAPPIPLDKDRVAAGLANAEDRMLFERAASALEGLASKHGGSVRGTATTLELVVMARRVAELKADGGVVLETLEPQRSTARLTADDLAGAFDRLEGQLRKRLNDRRVREGEEGLRARGVPLLARALGLRAVTPWPVGGSDREVVDLIGIDAQGRPVAAAVREELDLETIGELLDLGLVLQPVLALLLADAEPPLRLSAPRLAVAAQRYTPAAARALAALALGHDLYEIRSGANGLELVEISSAEAIERAVRPRSRRGPRREPGRGEKERPAEGRRPRAAEAEPAAEPAEEAARPESAEGGDDDEQRTRRRGRRRGRRRRGGREDGEAAARGEEGSDQRTDSEATDGESSRPLEVSLFDLDDDVRDETDEAESEGRARRRRPRRRGRRPGEESERRSEAARSSSDEEREPSDPEPDDDGDDEVDIDLDENITILSDDAPDFEIEEPSPGYDDEEDLGEDDGEEKRRVAEREKRRRARRSPPVPAPEPARPAPRRRAAIVACANRDALLAAVLLARDLRLVEGIWVYPQSELMTFFRGVVTDQREDTPLHVVGFTPSPAGEVLRTIPLYADRLHWYDHHDWPPEDLGAIRSLLPEDAIHLKPGAGSSLPAVLDTATRRSRFSDKLVDLCAARFTQHDYERWGRLWWSRLGEIATRAGDRRADVDALLVGRPSDLARESARVPAPPIPEEVTWVSRRDFRLVHFAGYAMVVLSVDDGLDIHLAARVARERYGAPFSLAQRGSSELFVLGADEMSGKRSFDVAGMLDHLASKLAYVTVLADEDHVSRFRLNGVAEHPERLEEVVSEIAMGRSTLEA
jgi:hypothetical protein